MKTFRHFRHALALLLVSVLLAGCNALPGENLQVEELLRAPRLSGDYGAVQTALNDWLGESAQLKYPMQGELLSPFLLQDLDGDGQQDAAVLYTTAQSTNVCIAILQRDDTGAWQVRQSVEGLADTVENVRLAQLRAGDDCQLVVGYVAAQGDHYLAVYAYNDGQLSTILEQSYEQYLVEDITGGGSQDLILTALEYIREHPDNYKDFHFDCNGVYHNGEYSIKCFHSEAHGSQDFVKAFANSCNGAFSSMGLELDLNRFAATAEELLYNRPLPFSGFPYKESSFNMKAGADIWEILQTSIGQGTTLITPLHSVLITSAVANGGTLMKPYLLDRVVSAGGEEVKKFLPEAYGSMMTADEAGKLTELMKAVTDVGTGSAVRTEDYTAAVKTGTAEFETGKETHAWFTGFAPAEAPKIAVTVLVEESGSGGKIAGPVARAMFDAYLLKK
mgnify:CR=1 FL=1